MTSAHRCGVGVTARRTRFQLTFGREASMTDQGDIVVRKRDTRGYELVA